MNHDATEVWILLERLGQFGSEGQHRRYILALEHHLLHGVPLDRAHNFLLVVALLLPVTLQYLSQLKRMALTGHEVHLDAFAEDSFEQRLNGIHRNQLSRHLEANRVDTLVQNVKRLGICSLGVIHNNVLTDIPLVRVLLVSSYKWELARKCIRRLQIRQVFSAIEGLYIKTFICSPHESFLEVGTFQIDFNLVQPFLFGRCSKLGKEFFFVCHKLCFII